MMIVKLSRSYFPDDFIDGTLVVYFDGQVSSVVVSSEFRNRNIFLLKGSTNRGRGTENIFLLQSTWGFSSGSLSQSIIFIYNSGGLRILVRGNVLIRLNFLFRNVFIGVISEGRVGVFRSIGCTPGFIVFIFRFCEHIF